MIPSVSVVVATHRRQQLLPSVLAPLLADPGAAEVVVVSDGNEDGTEELLRGWAAEQAKLRVLCLAPTGRQGARRAGIEASAGDVVLLLDDDVRAEPGLVAGHGAAHRHQHDRVVVGYMPVVTDYGAPGGAASALYADEYERHCRELERRPREILARLWGGNVSMPKSLALASTAEEFPASFGEDTHMGLTCLRLGATGVFDRRLAAAHLHSRTITQFVANAYEQGRGLVWLHYLHEDLIGPLAPDAFFEGLPGPLRRGLSALDERQLRRGAAAAAAASTQAARLGLSALERRATQLARKLSGRRGVAVALAEVAAHDTRTDVVAVS